MSAGYTGPGQVSRLKTWFKVTIWAPKIHTRYLRPVLQAYYLSPPTLLEESYSFLDPRHAQERAEEPFGGEVKLMPQSRFRSRQCLHSLRKYPSQYSLFKARTRVIRQIRRGKRAFCSRYMSCDADVAPEKGGSAPRYTYSRRIHCGESLLVFLQRVPWTL